MNSRSQFDTTYDAEAIKWKIRGHGYLTAVAIAVCAVFTLRGALGGSSVDEAGMVLAGIAGFAALVHVALTFCVPIQITRRHVLALMLVVAAPLAYLVPVFVRPTSGWPLNPLGPRQPRAEGMSRIIAPGDMVNIRWEEKGITVVNSHWRGTPQVEVVNAAELGCPKTLKGTGKNDNWQGLILSKHKYGEHPPELSVQFRLPTDVAVDGQPLRARIAMPISYPAPQGRTGFTDKSMTINREVEVVLAPLSVKQMYWASWWVGATLGLAGTSVGGFMLTWLTRRLRSRGPRSEPALPQYSFAHEVPVGCH